MKISWKYSDARRTYLFRFHDRITASSAQTEEKHQNPFEWVALLWIHNGFRDSALLQTHNGFRDSLLCNLQVHRWTRVWRPMNDFNTVVSKDVPVRTLFSSMYKSSHRNQARVRLRNKQLSRAWLEGFVVRRLRSFKKFWSYWAWIITGRNGLSINSWPVHGFTAEQRCPAGVKLHFGVTKTLTNLSWFFQLSEASMVLVRMLSALVISQQHLHHHEAQLSSHHPRLGSYWWNMSELKIPKKLLSRWSTHDTTLRNWVKKVTCTNNLN